jgi:hypothetical protein
MSEYQYYEFTAVDRPLTPEQMSELRALSTRAIITRNSFSNTYNFGDFRGNPRKLMESYFDAHVYVSNFGTVTFMLRLPRTVLADDTLARYATEDGLDWWTTDVYTILEWRLDGDPPDEWIEGEGWMSQLLPIRDELVRGDYRSLYIGWLSSVVGGSLEPEDEEDEEEDSDSLEEEDYDEGSGTFDREPPVPAGLGSLTGSQVALAEFLCIDSDLIAAAAEASPDVPANDVSDPRVAEWVAQLPEQEVRALIARILHGEGLRIQTELQSRYYRSRSEATENSLSGADGSRRTAADLVARAAQTARERKRQELEERERKRHAHLAGLAPRFSELWATVRALAEEQKASSYDKVCALLVDMRDAYAQAGRRMEFDAEFARFLEQYSRRTALVRRLKEARLTS